MDHQWTIIVVQDKSWRDRRQTCQNKHSLLTILHDSVLAVRRRYENIRASSQRAAEWPQNNGRNAVSTFVRGTLTTNEAAIWYAINTAYLPVCGPATYSNILLAVFGRPFVKGFARCYRTVVLPVCPVRNVGVLWPNGWMDQDVTWCGGRRRPRPHCVRWWPSSPLKRGTAVPLFSAMSVVAKRSPISATAEHLYKWGVQICNLLVWNFLRFHTPKIMKIGSFLTELL